MKYNYHDKPKNEKDYDKWAEKAFSQCVEANKTNKYITCVCDKKINIIYAYRCYHCGLWFCEKCSKEHFGERPKSKFFFKREKTS